MAADGRPKAPRPSPDRGMPVLLLLGLLDFLLRAFVFGHEILPYVEIIPATRAGRRLLRAFMETALQSRLGQASAALRRARHFSLYRHPRHSMLFRKPTPPARPATATSPAEPRWRAPRRGGETRRHVPAARPGPEWRGSGLSTCRAKSCATSAHSARRDPAQGGRTRRRHAGAIEDVSRQAGQPEARSWTRVRIICRRDQREEAARADPLEAGRQRAGRIGDPQIRPRAWRRSACNRR